MCRGSLNVQVSSCVFHKLKNNNISDKALININVKRSKQANLFKHILFQYIRQLYNSKNPSQRAFNKAKAYKNPHKPNNLRLQGFKNPADS